MREECEICKKDLSKENCDSINDYQIGRTYIYCEDCFEKKVQPEIMEKGLMQWMKDKRGN